MAATTPTTPLRPLHQFAIVAYNSSIRADFFIFNAASSILELVARHNRYLTIIIDISAAGANLINKSTVLNN